jgi:hypothetical protein
MRSVRWNDLSLGALAQSGGSVGQQTPGPSQLSRDLEPSSCDVWRIRAPGDTW